MLACSLYKNGKKSIVKKKKGRMDLVNFHLIVYRIKKNHKNTLVYLFDI